MRLAVALAAALGWTLCAGLCGQSRAADEAQAHAGKGAELMLAQSFTEAQAEFERALALDPKLTRARLQLGACLFAQGLNAEARREFERVQSETGDGAAVEYYLGRLDLLNNDYEGAIRRMQKLAADPAYPQAAFYLGMAYVSAGDAKAGVHWLEQAAQRSPRDFRVHYRLARAYTLAGRSADAEREFKLYNQFTDEQKRTETLVRDCNTALTSAPIERAREACKRILDPNDPEKLVLLGQLFGSAGKFTDAIAPLERATQLDQLSFEAWHNLGLSYFRLERYQDARLPLERAAALQPDFFGTLNLLGATLYMLGDDAAALPVLERAHRLEPNDHQVEAVLEQLRAAQKK
ncbi:MAG: tetratricopeptide repeat protein [Bryobacteraceae bacterium]|nr:tetratricopeptide repeat protein [Bryobacteraceae bacterium]